jgi:hypothetical protein
MDRNDPHRRFVLLYCNQSTQTRPESDHDAESESSDFSPIRIGKRMSPASAMHRKPHQFNKEEPSQLHRCRTGLGRTNILNVVNTTAVTAPVQHGKVTLIRYTLRRYHANHVNSSVFALIRVRPNPCQSETQTQTLERKTLPMNAH